MSNILGIIPARAGSKRLPNKNKLPFDGKPLIQHIIEAGQKAKRITQLVVNTDDTDILAMEKDFQGLTFLKRPEELAKDDSPAIAYVQYTIEKFKKEGITFDAVVILQPTSPLTLPEDIDGTIDLLLNSKADSSVSVMKLDHATHPVKMKTMEGQKLNPYFEEERGRMAEHELTEVYVRNCSVYVTRTPVMEGGQIIGDTCLGYLMPRERSIDINDRMDFTFAEFLKKGLSKGGE